MSIPSLVVLYKSCSGLKDVLWLGLFFLKAKPIFGIPNGPGHRHPSLHFLPCESFLQLLGQAVKILHHSSIFLQPSLSHRPHVFGHGTLLEHMPDYFIGLPTYCTQWVCIYFFAIEVGMGRKNIIARSPQKILNLGGTFNFHILFQSLFSSPTVEYPTPTSRCECKATWKAVLTMNCWALFSFQCSLSLVHVLLRWRCIISFCVASMKVACIKGRFHCMDSWWMRSPTFRVVSAPGLNRGGYGSQLLLVSLILCPSLIFHMEPSRITSLVANKLRSQIRDYGLT